MKRICVTAAVSLLLGALIPLSASAIEDLERPAWDIFLVSNQQRVGTFGYVRNLPSGAHWLDGDRWGYSCAYMFLARPEEPKTPVFRVTFRQVAAAAAYTAVRDKFMAEGQRFFDGTPNPNAPHQISGPEACLGLYPVVPYEPLTGDPGPRPVLTISDAGSGTVLETRDYTAQQAPGVEYEIESATPDLVVVVGYQGGVPVFAIYYEIMDPAAVALACTQGCPTASGDAAFALSDGTPATVHLAAPASAAPSSCGTGTIALADGRQVETTVCIG
ncbi:MAG: hypothetical protein ACT4PO_12220 [Actinomycetota bacterium]